MLCTCNLILAVTPGYYRGEWHAPCSAEHGAHGTSLPDVADISQGHTEEHIPPAPPQHPL